MPDFSHEAQFAGPVIGIDEAGRGPWAGPVTVTAIWLGGCDAAALPDGIDDSKKLKAPIRSKLAAQLAAMPYVHHTETVDVAVIDQLGILQATFRGMVLAAEGVAKKMQAAGLPPPLHALVDGNLLPPDMPFAATALVKGDSRSLSIAAASIIAKASRDDIMTALHQDHPHYGWDRNMGYGTKAHVAGLDHYGVSPHHRHSFKPVRRYLRLAAD
jgi:ribonuclease HII